MKKKIMNRAEKSALATSKAIKRQQIQKKRYIKKVYRRFHNQIKVATKKGYSVITLFCDDLITLRNFDVMFDAILEVKKKLIEEGYYIRGSYNKIMHDYFRVSWGKEIENQKKIDALEKEMKEKKLID